MVEANSPASGMFVVGTLEARGSGSELDNLPRRPATGWSADVGDLGNLPPREGRGDNTLVLLRKVDSHDDHDIFVLQLHERQVTLAPRETRSAAANIPVITAHHS